MQIGFRLFGTDHVAILWALVSVGLAAHLAIRSGGEACGRWVRWGAACALAVTHLTESLVALWQGWYELDMLPLQLCDVAAMLAVYGLITLDRRAVEPLYFFALSGTLPALITPELDVGFPDLRFVVYFLEHGLTVMAALLLVIGLGIRPRPRAWLRAFVQVNGLALIAAAANRALGTNFLYLGRKPADPTPFDLFGPWPGYLVVLEVMAFAVFRLLDAALAKRSIWPETRTQTATSDVPAY